MQWSAFALLDAATAAQVLLWRLEWDFAPHGTIADALPVALRTLWDAGTVIMTADAPQQLAELSYLRSAVALQFSTAKYAQWQFSCEPQQIAACGSVHCADRAGGRGGGGCRFTRSLHERLARVHQLSIKVSVYSACRRGVGLPHMTHWWWPAGRNLSALLSSKLYPNGAGIALSLLQVCSC